MEGRAVLADDAPGGFSAKIWDYMKIQEFPNRKRAGTKESFVHSLDRPARPVFLGPRTDVRGRFEEKKRGAPHGGLPLCLQPWHVAAWAGESS